MANVEELTRQNEELRKTMESQNAERRRTGENQNEEDQTLKPTDETRSQEKIPSEWRMSFVT